MLWVGQRVSSSCVNSRVSATELRAGCLRGGVEVNHYKEHQTDDPLQTLQLIRPYQHQEHAQSRTLARIGDSTHWGQTMIREEGLSPHFYPSASLPQITPPTERRSIAPPTGSTDYSKSPQPAQFPTPPSHKLAWPHAASSPELLPGAFSRSTNNQTTSRRPQPKAS